MQLVPWHPSQSAQELLALWSPLPGLHPDDTDLSLKLSSGMVYSEKPWTLPLHLLPGVGTTATPLLTHPEPSNHLLLENQPCLTLLGAEKLAQKRHVDVWSVPTGH